MANQLETMARRLARQYGVSPPCETASRDAEWSVSNRPVEFKYTRKGGKEKFLVTQNASGCMEQLELTQNKEDVLARYFRQGNPPSLVTLTGNPETSNEAAFIHSFVVEGALTDAGTYEGVHDGPSGYLQRIPLEHAPALAAYVVGCFMSSQTQPEA